MGYIQYCTFSMLAEFKITKNSLYCLKFRYKSVDGNTMFRNAVSLYNIDFFVDKKFSIRYLFRVKRASVAIFKFLILNSVLICLIN